MLTIWQIGQKSSARHWAARLAWGSLALGLTALTGCASSPMAASQSHDPLHGVLVPPGGIPQPTNTPKSPAAPVPSAQTMNQGSPPASLASVNNATLAGTWNGPLGRPLQIDDNNSTGPSFLPGQLTSGSKTQQVPGTPTFLAPNLNPKVEQVPDAKPPLQPGTPTGTWETPRTDAPGAKTGTASTTPTSAEILAKQLQQRGVLNQKQDVVPEGVRLTCYVSSERSGGVRILEVTATDYTSAVQAILKQLEK